MEKKKVEELKEKYKKIDEGMVEKAADAIIQETNQDKMKRWEMMYFDRIRTEYEGMEKILSTFEFPERISKVDLTERVLYLLSEVYKLQGEIKGLREAV